MNVCVGTVEVSSPSREEKPPLAPQKVCVGKPSRPNLSMREIAQEPCEEPYVEQRWMYDGVYDDARCVDGSMVWRKWAEKSLFRAR